MIERRMVIDIKGRIGIEARGQGEYVNRDGTTGMRIISPPSTLPRPIAPRLICSRPGSRGQDRPEANKRNIELSNY